MKKRVIAVFLILLLLLIPNVVGVLGDPDGGDGAGDTRLQDTLATTEASVETETADVPTEEAAAVEAEPSAAEEPIAANVNADAGTGDSTEETKTLPAAGGTLESGTYVLTEDLRVDSLTVTNGNTTMIDLNGNTLNLNCPANWGIYVNGGAALTIKDSAGGGKIICAKYGINNGNNGAGTLYFTGGTLSGESTMLATRAGSTSYVTGGTLKTSNGQTIQNQGTTYVSGSDTLIDATNSYGVWNIMGAYAKISDGVTVKSNAYAVGNGYTANDGSKVEIENSTLIGASGALENKKGCNASATGTEFISTTPAVISNAGIFTADITCSIIGAGKLGVISNSGTINVDCDYLNGDWISYVKTKYPDEIPSSEYALDAENKEVHIYSADGLAWWAYRLSVNARFDFSDYHIYLENDIDLYGKNWRANITNNFNNAVFDGKNHVISNLMTVGLAGNGSGSVGYGFIGDTSGAAVCEIKNITFDSAYIYGGNGTNKAGVLFGCLGIDVKIDNVHIINSTTNSHHSGAIAGVIDDEANSIIIKNCSVDNCDIDTPNVHLRAGGLIGAVEKNNVNLVIQGTHVRNTTIRAGLYSGGFIGLVASKDVVVIIDRGSSVENIILPEAEYNFTHLHTVTVDGERSDNIRGGQKNHIIDGLYLDGGRYADSMQGMYYGGFAEFYIDARLPQSYDAKIYTGFEGAEHYGTLNYPVESAEVLVGSDNYDYATYTIKPSVIYYAVYSDGVNTRNVLYGYEYVTTGEAVSGRTMYGDLDCTGVKWYTDQACTLEYDMSAAVTEGITLYTPLVLKDQNGAIVTDRLTTASGSLPTEVDGQPATSWVALQKGSLEVATDTPAHIPDMTLELYTSVEAVPRTLTIRRTSGTDVQDYWYTVSGDNGSTLQVAIPKGQSSVTIIGVAYGVTYTVTEASDWSWRYQTEAPKSIKITTVSSEVSFDGGRTNSNWLNGLSRLTF